MVDLSKVTTRSFLERLLTITLFISSLSVMPWMKQWSLAASNWDWNSANTSCVYIVLHCFSMAHDVFKVGSLCMLLLSAINSSWLWHSKAVSNLNQNSTKDNFRQMKRLKNEFALSERDVVLRTPARGTSIKYAGIQDARIKYLVENHSFPVSWKSLIKEGQLLSNSSGVSDPQTHELNLS
jgi:hypothetical protein